MKRPGPWWGIYCLAFALAQGPCQEPQSPPPPPAAAPAPVATRLRYDLPAYDVSRLLQREPDVGLDALTKRILAAIAARVGERATVQHVGGTAFVVDVPGDAACVAAVRALVEITGRLEMRVVATADFAQDGVRFDLDAERKRLQAWLDAGGRDPVLADWRRIDSFNDDREHGPLASGHLRWFPHVVEPRADGTWSQVFAKDTAELVGVTPMAPAVVAVFDDAEWNGGRVPAARTARTPLLEFVAVNTKEVGFTHEHLQRDATRVAQHDDAGRGPEVEYMLRPEFAMLYADWSEKHLRRHVAIVVDGRVRSAPYFVTRIPGRGRISGLARAEAEALAICLGADDLPIAPVLLRQDVVPQRTGTPSTRAQQPKPPR